MLKLTALDIMVVAAMVLPTWFATMNLLLSYVRLPQPEARPPRGPLPEVAIIVPVKDDPSIFNSIPYYRSLIYPHYHVIIVDDSDSPQFVERLRSAVGSDERFILLHREPWQRRGRKGDALNFGLMAASRLSPKYVVIMDADHRPPRNFLLKGVSLIGGHRALIGYQRHSVGAYDLFGKLYFYSQAASIRILRAKQALGMPPIFTGSVGMFDYATISKYMFDGGSITEDWELTLRMVIGGDFDAVVSDEFYADAAVPLNITWFVNQQLRWASGTINDFVRHLRGAARSGLRNFVGLAYNGLLFSQSLGIVFLLLTYLFFYRAGSVTSLAATAVFAYLLASWVVTFTKASRDVEGRAPSLALVLYSILMTYFTSFVHSAGTVMGLLGMKGWKVTRRRG